jgi:pilus assembly protein Flp/PilA
MPSLSTLLSDENGATAVEYGLIAAAIAAIIIVAVFAIGRKVNNNLTNLNTHMPN